MFASIKMENPNASTTIAQLQDASLGYGEHTLISHFSLEIKSGDFIAMVGPNGSGKTTIMRSLLGLIPIFSGHRSLFGKLPEQLDPQLISYVPQRMALNKMVPLTVREFLSLKSKSLKKSDLLMALKKVELEGIEKKSIHELSGGQLQRVLLAFALMGNPRLICLDEASEGMDIKSEKSFYDLLKHMIAEKDAAVFLISHDISAVSEHANRVICVNKKILYDGSPKSSDFHSCLHKIYGEESVIHGHHH